MSGMMPLDIRTIVPGGILVTDHWHIGTNDNTCSRCRQVVPDDQVPLMLWDSSGENMLIYCEPCLGVDPPLKEDDEVGA